MTVHATKGNIMTAKKNTTSTMVKLSSVYATKAQRRDIDTTRAAKLVRAKMRSNFDAVVKMSPNIAQHKQSANDGNRWPSEITRECAEYLLAAK